MTVATQAERDRQRANDALPGDRIQGMALKHGDLGSAISDIRRGTAEVGDIGWILPENRARLSRVMKTRRENSYDRSDPKQMKEYASLIKRSQDRTAEGAVAAKELAAYREFELTNDIMATPFALAAFQEVNLSADELPLIVRPRSRNLQRFTVRYMAQDGGARSDQWRTTKEAESLEMEMLSTDRVQYPLMDLQAGNINQLDAINVELQYDMSMKFDELAKTNLDGLETDSGLRDFLSIHPSIDPANIPDKNHLDLSGVDVAGHLSIGKMKTILNHIALFGAAGDPEHSIKISAIFLSPQNMRDSWDFVSLVSGFDGGSEVEPKDTVPNSVRESIYAGGMFTSAWGYKWSWVPNAQLPLGRMYILTDKPVGWLFTKTEFDGSISWENDPDHIEKNLGEILWRRTAKFVTPDLWRYRVVIVDL